MKFLKILTSAICLFTFSSCFENPSLNTKSNFKGMLPYTPRDQQGYTEVNNISINKKQDIDSRVESILGACYQQMINNKIKWSVPYTTDKGETRNTSEIINQIENSINKLYLGSDKDKRDSDNLISLIYSIGNLYAIYNSLNIQQHDVKPVLIFLINIFMRNHAQYLITELNNFQKTISPENNYSLIQTIKQVLYYLNQSLTYFNTTSFQSETNEILNMLATNPNLIKTIENINSETASQLNIIDRIMSTYRNQVRIPNNLQAQSSSS